MTVLGLLPVAALGSILYSLYRRGIPRSMVLPLGYLIWMTSSAFGGRIFSFADLLGSTLAWVSLNLSVIIIAWYSSRQVIARSATPPLQIDTLTVRNLRSLHNRIPLGLVLVLCGLTILFLVGLIANLRLSQTMDDSLTAYLARAGFWIHNGNTHPIVTSDYNFVINAYPGFPSFSTINWIVLGRDDGLAAADQWLGCLANAALIFSVCRQLGGTRNAGLISASLWISMPLVLLQSQMVLTDQVALVGALLATYYCIDWLKTQNKPSLALALFGLFVLCGSKQTGFFLGPTLAVGLLLIALVASTRALLIQTVRVAIRSPLTYVATPVAALVFLFEYIQNLRYYGHPLGPPASFEYFAAGNIDIAARVASLLENGKRTLVAGMFADVPPWLGDQISPVRNWAQAIYPYAMTGTTRFVGVGWFGFLQTLLALAVIPILLLIRRENKTLTQLGSIWFVSFGYLATLFVVRINFSEAFSRYSFLTVSLLLAPAGLIYDHLTRTRIPRRLLNFVAGGLLMVAMAQGTWSFLGNGIRPLLGPNNVWNESVYAQFTKVQGFVAPEDIGRVLYLMEHCVAEDTSIILDDLYKFPISPFFGSSYRRTVSFVERPYPTKINRAYLRARDAQAILLTEDLHKNLDFVSPKITSASFGSLHLLFIDPKTARCDGALRQRPF